MSEGTVRGGKEGEGGVGRRAAVGVKLVSRACFFFCSYGRRRLTRCERTEQCLNRLAADKSKTSPSPSDPLLRPKETKAIDLLMSKMILDSYSSSDGKRADESAVKVVREWIGGRGLTA